MKSFLRLLAGIALALALAACQAPAGHGSQEPALQLKLYHAPAADSQSIARNLSSVLESAAFRVGKEAHSEMRATQPFPGTVMVLAPASLQPSIASAIEEMAKASGEKSGRAPGRVPLRVQFWLVQAVAGAGDESIALSPLAPTLKQLRASLGPSHFVLVDSAAVSVVAPRNDDDVTKGAGDLTTSRGHEFLFHVVATPANDLVLNVQLSPASNTAADAAFRRLNTTVAVSSGEYVVLAQAPPATKPTGTAAADATLMNLLVARVERTSPTAH